MAVGKALNKGYYSQSQGAREIAMPPLPEQSQTEQSNQAIGAVPDQVPQEVYQEMNQEEQVQESQAQEQEHVENDSVEESTTEESPTQESPTQESQNQEVAENSTVSKKTNDPSTSFKAIREAKEKAERERDFLMQQMLEYQKKQQSEQTQQRQPEAPPIDDDINFDIDEDGLVEGRYVKKVTNKLKNLEKQLKNYESQAQQQSIETKIKSEFPDFDKVVSSANVELLNSQFPEVARTLRDTNDLYSKAVSAYNVMKKFGIHRDDPHLEQRVKALTNTQKPKPLASMSPQQGESPLSKANAFANGLTEDLKAHLRKEMSMARRNS